MAIDERKSLSDADIVTASVRQAARPGPSRSVAMAARDADGSDADGTDRADATDGTDKADSDGTDRADRGGRDADGTDRADRG
jgi:hypothetical protein